MKQSTPGHFLTRCVFSCFYMALILYLIYPINALCGFPGTGRPIISNYCILHRAHHGKNAEVFLKHFHIISIGSVSFDSNFPTSEERRTMENIGKYRILAKVGQGGIASVYLAEDERIGKKWAIKAIPKSNIPKDGILLLRNLDHPSLPRIVEELEGDGMYYEVMDYFEGIPLDLWAETGPDALDAICIAQEILESVAYLHSREIPIIHRDLKPSNFIITADRKVKLVDFDLAVSGEQSGMLPMGTKGYAPPEQYRGICTMRGDVYALGRTIGCIMASVRTEEAGIFERRLIRQIAEVCDTASSEDMKKRFGDAGEMLEAFEKCCRKRKLSKIYLAGGIAAVLMLILFISGRDILLDALGENAAARIRTNYENASALICHAISENDRADALKADEYIKNSKHLLGSVESTSRTELELSYYTLHHQAMIVSGSLADTDSERTDAFRTCISEDIEYEDYLKKEGSLEKLFCVYSDDVTLCRMIGDEGSAERFFEKAMAMPGISSEDRIMLMYREEAFLHKEEK